MTIHKLAIFRMGPYTILLIIVPVGLWRIEHPISQMEYNEKQDPRLHTTEIPIYQAQKEYLHYLMYATHYSAHIFFVMVVGFQPDHHLTSAEYQYDKIVYSTTYRQ